MDAYEWLAPESSPVARGAAIAARLRCADPTCRAERQRGSSTCRESGADTACADTDAYWRAIQLKHDLATRLQAAPDNRLLKGERVARQRHCFRCHGQLGQGGYVNAGALKGYIPGYFGRDFRTLTDGGRKAVVREWIETGTSATLTSQPITGWIASHYLDNQTVAMPSFSGLAEAEIDLLADYVIALNAFGPLDIERLEDYANATAITNAGLGSYAAH